MKDIKKEILRLRDEGKSYKEIQKELGCSKGTISYHCGEGQKEKSQNRQRKLRKDNVLIRKVDHFKQPTAHRKERQKKEDELVSGTTKRLQSKADDFQRERAGRGHGKHLEKAFSYKDVLDYYGEQTTCYLTGRTINLLEPRSYHFDHKVPASKGGDTSFNNLGIACKEANKAKDDLSIEEFIQLCKDVLEHNGYVITKNG